MKTKINELCRAVGMTTAYQLQKKTDLSPSQAARLYRDEVEAMSLSVLEKLCDVLKCSPNDVFGYNEPQTVKPQSVPVDTKKPASKPETPQTTASDGDLMTVKDIQTYLKKTESSVLRYVKSGKLKAEKIGRGWRIYRADVLEFAESDFFKNL
jgi:excisionase family DNA binding protein